MLYRIFKLSICLLLSFTLFTKCGVYSFSGVSISPEVKTVSIDFFPNMAPLVVPLLSNTFTDALQQKFITQTRLLLVTSDGDIALSGEIRGYDIAPTAVTGDDVASKNRLTIRVRVKFENKIDPNQNYDREFSAYEDFPGTQSITQVQNVLIERIVETLSENIFNASVANW